MIYNSLILSRINYGITTWAFGNCDRIQVLQKKALRNVNKSPYFTHSLPVCKSLGTIIFDDIFKLSCSKFYYKYLNNLLPKYFYDAEFIKKYLPKRQNLRITKPCEYQNYVTEHSDFRPEYYKPQAKKQTSEKRLQYYLACLLNSERIPKCVLDKATTHSFNGFSNYYKKYIISNYDITCNIENCFTCSRNQ